MFTQFYQVHVVDPEDGVVRVGVGSVAWCDVCLDVDGGGGVQQATQPQRMGRDCPKHCHSVSCSCCCSWWCALRVLFVLLVLCVLICSWCAVLETGSTNTNDHNELICEQVMALFGCGDWVWRRGVGGGKVW